MKSTTVSDTERRIKMLCMLVLVFIPLNMLATPVLDYISIEDRQANWTVTLSAFVFVLAAMPILALVSFAFKTRQEKLFFRCAFGFFLYALLITMYFATARFYPIYGLTSAVGSTFVGMLFYVAARDNLLSAKVVFYSLSFSLVLVIMPLLLVQMNPEGFARLATGVGAKNILYGYENPRAVGWAATISLSLLAAYLSTTPKADRIHPVFVALIIVSATTLFWSGSRGGVVAFVAGILFVLAISSTRNARGFALVVLGIALGAAISIVFHLPSEEYGIFFRLNENLEQESIAAVSSGRTNLWRTTVSYILERPFTGYGFLPHKNLAGFSHGSAHNIILDAWLWLGLIVGTVMIGVGLVFWVNVLKLCRTANDRYVSGLFCMVTTLLIYSMVSGPYVRTFPMLLFAIAAGVLLGRRASMTRA